MRSKLLSISRLLRQVENKTHNQHYTSKTHTILTQNKIEEMEIDQLYDHIMNQISFIHFPEYAYLRSVKHVDSKPSTNIRMMRDIGTN
jgi:hypothetical protein